MTLPPPAPSHNRPPLDQTNAWADFWYYGRGQNVIPMVTKYKTGKKGYEYQIYHHKPVPEDVFAKWKAENAFADGMAISISKVWRGPYKHPLKDTYLIFVDLDNEIAIDEFCTKNGVKTSLRDIADKFIVEQHKDNPHKAHVYFYSDVPFPKKSSDKGKPGVDEEKMPMFEVKGRGGHGVAYCTPSIHEHGHPYEIIGTIEPIVLGEEAAKEMIQRLDSICRKYGLHYLENVDSDGNRTLIPISELEKEDFVIYEGQNRHEALLRRIESKIRKKYGKWTWDEIKDNCYAWNYKHCSPPLGNKEFERQWKDAIKFIVPKIEEEILLQKQRQPQQQQRQSNQASSLPQQQPPSIPAAFRNDYFEYLVFCAQKTIKEENALIRQILLTKLSAYSDDPNNLGIMAPTAAGKTYPIMQCVRFTPGGKEVRIVGSMTPKVLIREQGVLVDRDRNPIGQRVRKLKAAIKTANKKNKFDEANQYQEELEILLEDSAYILDLSGKTLIFLEPPHPELWNLLKPILSHDAYEMEHPFVDNIGRGLEVKRVITRGWPACIFCSAKDESKWEIWPEIESRFMISSPNMVKPKYEQGNQLIALKKWQPRGVKQQLIISDKEVQLGKDCFLYLKHQNSQFKEKTDSPVWAPFGELVGQIFPSDKGQDNRAFNRFASILNIITLCKAHLRYKVLYDDEELVIPSLRDLQETLHIMQNMTGLPPHKLKFYKDYILPLWKEYNGVPLQTKQICDYYNAQNPNNKLKMNSDNLRKNYLQELVNHNYLEQEQDGSTKSPKYLFTPLVLDEGNDDEDKGDGNKTSDSQKKQLATTPTLEQVFDNLQFSKLLLPKNHAGIPKDWLKQQILQLSGRRLTDAQLKITFPEGQEIAIDEFIVEYEKEQKLHLFFSAPRLVGGSNSPESTTSGGSKEGNNEKSTTNEAEEDKKSKTLSKVGEVGALYIEEPKSKGEKCLLEEQDNNSSDQTSQIDLESQPQSTFNFDVDVKASMTPPEPYRLVEKAMSYDSNKSFTKYDWVFTCQMWPNLRWTVKQSEQALERLLQEGKIVEFESGRYETTEELRMSKGVD